MKATVVAALFFIVRTAVAQTPGTIEKGDFRFAYDERGISQLANAHDPFGAVLTTAGGRGGRGGAPSAPAPLALTVSYRAGTDTAWASVARGATWSASPEHSAVTYTSAANAPLRVTETYKTDGRALD